MSTPQYIKDAQNTYNSKFDLIQLKLPKGTKERIKAVLEDGESISKYCVDAVLVSVESDEDFKNIKEKEKILASSESQETPPVQEESRPDPPCEGNNFDGLQAMDWEPENHRGKVPHPPQWGTENTYWNATEQEWYDKLTFY